VAAPDGVPQSAVRDLAVELHPHLEGSRYLSIFDNAGIERRTLVRPPAWYAGTHSRGERARLAFDEVCRLGARAAADALGRAGLAGADVDALVVVTTTGLRSPGFDVELTEALGLRAEVRRVPVLGMASLGGAAGLALAADLVRAGHREVLVVAAEANTMSFVPDDDSVGALVSMALFSDGAAAVVVSAEAAPPATVAGGEPVAGDAPLRMAGAHSTLVPDSLDVMGFDPTDDGFRWRLAPHVPEVARRETAASVDAALASVGWTRDDLDHVLVHPGGVKVLAAVAEAVGLPDRALDRSTAVLADHGNLSSATVLAVLGRYLAEGAPAGRSLLSAMGPGFAFEHVLLER
jgi:alkylresorcinol/alkylpyrone synthase